MTIQTYQATQAPGSAYTSTGNTAVTFMSLCNYSTTDITANVYIVPSGESWGNNTVVFQSLPLNASDTYQFYLGGEKLILGNLDTIQVTASVGNALNVVTSYTNI